ncbi:prepilin-type N-terminal cleavage/methylation domain-containing protein [Ruficoccus amylovorans]|uniref:Prepilin-type N-terminal cleavage/methylation domain-containing protein n=1 Tax=Ruficoccus amylovorans TaxID=1804625 RepID=A0A842HIZ6_9BACT|nr:prepilin-type N-terminal cleavage/methylation domain-containing protein [Ruficoccus amylovorans]MBC2595574.1 prepilin-type N-terminal cleavage/methylation domain-containing protein [Ruficoccus amylovorans]
MLIPRQKSPRPAFTLIELLTVIAIIGVLAAILIPVIGSVRERMNDSRCVSNLRQIYGYCLAYAADNGQKLPTVNHTFYNDLWPYAYPEESNPVISGPGFPDDLKGTVFECYAMSESEGAANMRSYGINSYLRPFYLEHQEEDDQDPSGPRLTAVHELPKTVFISDTYSDSRIRPPVLQKAFQRHGGHVNALFLDGHVEAVTEDFPGVMDSGSTFWRGVN